MKNIMQAATISVLALTLLFTACKKDEIEPSFSHFTETELEEITKNTCIAVIPDDLTYFEEKHSLDGVEDRATGYKNKFWNPGTTLRVRFLNGSTSLQNKVMTYAKQWEEYANIKFQKVSSGTSEIRVNFSNEGHWSYIGKDNAGIPQNQKTMNLALTNSSSNSEFSRVVLHEFGHAIGLGHEHKNPLSDIPWNKPAVYAYYAQTQGWNAQKVDEQVLNKLTWEQSQHTNPDTESIMHYPVSASLTTNGFYVPWNTVLSEVDKEFIGRMYSSKVLKVRHAVNTTGTITFWLNGIYHTIKPGETMSVPAFTTGNELSIWECPGGNCKWDSYFPAYGKKYKIVAQGSTTNFKLVQE